MRTSHPSRCITRIFWRISNHPALSRDETGVPGYRRKKNSLITWCDEAWVTPMLLLFLWQTGINSSTADFYKMPRTWSISTNVTCGPRLPKFDACGIRTKVIIMAYFRSYIWWTRAVGSDSQSDLRTNFLKPRISWRIKVRMSNGWLILRGPSTCLHQMRHIFPCRAW